MADWKSKVFKLNYTYLSCLKEAGGHGDGLAAVLGVSAAVLKVLEAADDQVLHSISQVAVPLLKIPPEQIEVALNAADNGDELRAKAMLLIRGVGDGDPGAERG